MQGMRNLYHKFCEFWTPARVGILFIVICILSLLPILYCSFYDYATGDDLGYSYIIHQLMIHGGSIRDILKALWDEVVLCWYGYQGTWSSIILFQLQPGLLGEKAYIITPWIALFFLNVPTGYLLWDLLVERLHYNKGLFWAILSILSMLSVQYMPRIRGGAFWYTSVAHYVIPYGAALLCITWAMKWIDTGWKRYYVPMLIVMAYLGGAGYPPIVLATVLFLMIIVGALCGIIGRLAGGARRLRALLLIVPLLLELIGFAISAVAPGNKTRGGSDFGFGGSRAISAIIAALVHAITEGIGYFISGRLLIVGLVLIAVLAFEAYDVVQNRYHARYPLVVVILAYLVSASVRTPELYAAVEVSGGVPDVDYFTFLICAVAAICYCMIWLKNWMYDRQYSIALSNEQYNRCVRTPFILVVMLFCIVFSRHFIGGTVDYTCVTFIRSGALADFEYQMQERLEILLDDDIQDVVLPEMNEYQGPIMHMPLMRDPEAYTNSITARYYGKNSVIAVPREEYYSEYKK